MRDDEDFERRGREAIAPAATLRGSLEAKWPEAIDRLKDYIAIPAVSPVFDPDWSKHGQIDAAINLVAEWGRRSLAPVTGATLDIIRLEGRTPVIIVEIPGTVAGDTLLLYGHLDKQPEMSGWDDGLGPWTPVMRGERLYGRGGADDGYAFFAAVMAMTALFEAGAPRPRTVILIETCEESGSYDLPFYLEALDERIGQVGLVICLDSGCGDYERLWLANSLRGRAEGVLSVRVLDEGVHSGTTSGIAPSSFRILRALLSRIEDEGTGKILLDEAYAEVSPETRAKVEASASILGESVFSNVPFAPGVQPVTHDPTELLLNRAWRPQLTVTGLDGLPPISSAGTTLHPVAAAKLSLRLPPGVSAQAVGEALRERLQADPPYGAQVQFSLGTCADGWSSPPLAGWLEKAVNEASLTAFGSPAAFVGEGGGIPFMWMLGERYPEAQFMVTGVLGPNSNAHGPNEFLDLPTAKRVSLAAALVAQSYAVAMPTTEQAHIFT